MVIFIINESAFYFLNHSIKHVVRELWKDVQNWMGRLNDLFCPTNSQNQLKDTEFILMQDKEKQNLKPENVWYFCLKMTGYQNTC